MLADLMADEAMLSELQGTLGLAEEGTIGRQHPADFATNTLQEKFEELVMCDYTPRKPSELPMAQWASYKQLLRVFEPHAQVRQLGPGNLKQLIIAWYKSHPAFAGLEVNKWCKKLTDNDPLVPPCSQVYKFSFEYTPGGSPLREVASRKEDVSRKRGRLLTLGL